MKSKVCNLVVDKLKHVPNDLKKLSDVVDKEVLNISYCNADKQDLDNKIKDVENKIPEVSGLATNTAFNTKIGEVENKRADVSKVVTNTAV